MRRVSSLVVLAAMLGGVALMACNALQTTEVTLDISGTNPLGVFTGSYETTSNGVTTISGSPPKSYTFNVRKSYDVVAVQLGYVGAGELTAKLISDGVTRDSATTTSLIGTLTLSWTPK